MLRSGALCSVRTQKPDLFPKRDGHGARDQGKRDQIARLRALAEADPGKPHENDQRDRLLKNFELIGRKASSVTQSVCRNLQSVLRKCEHPASQNRDPERCGSEAEVTVPGYGHEKV